MSADPLDVQIATAVTRFATLQRRADALPDGKPKILQRAVRELEDALEGLRAAQEQLLDQRSEIERMHDEIAVQRDKYQRLFNNMPDPYIVTGLDSLILEANRAASALLNVSQRFLIGKSISVFVSEGRDRFVAQADWLGRTGGSIELTLRVRPRERAPLTVTAQGTVDAGELRWSFHPLVGLVHAPSDQAV